MGGLANVPPIIDASSVSCPEARLGHAVSDVVLHQGTGRTAAVRAAMGVKIDECPEVIVVIDQRMNRSLIMAYLH